MDVPPEAVTAAAEVIAAQRRHLWDVDFCEVQALARAILEAAAPHIRVGTPLAEALSAVEAIDANLDARTSPEYLDQPLARRWARVAKVAEEAGEAIAALIACTGENFRKGVSGTEAELLGELADTASAAICAIQHHTKDKDLTWAVLSSALVKAQRRIGTVPGGAS